MTMTLVELSLKFKNLGYSMLDCDMTAKKALADPGIESTHRLLSHTIRISVLSHKNFCIIVASSMFSISMRHYKFSATSISFNFSQYFFSFATFFDIH
jgi:hypothetical protein